jgi:hypothetical protein
VQAQTNSVLARMVDLELARIVEHWRFEGDAVQILVALPAGGCGCGTKHCWFVNRDGKTRCWECDAVYVKERDALFLGGLKGRRVEESKSQRVGA